MLLLTDENKDTRDASEISGVIRDLESLEQRFDGAMKGPQIKKLRRAIEKIRQLYRESNPK